MDPPFSAACQQIVTRSLVVTTGMVSGLILMGAEGEQEVGDGQGRAGRVDVPGRVHGGPNVREAEPMGDGGERVHAWMAGNGTDSEIDVAVRREVDATVGVAVIGRLLLCR
jgi:hypothetical protein